MLKSQHNDADVGRPWTAAILIALIIMGVYLFMAARTTLWDRDEPYYAQVAVEMVDSGDYLVPTFNGQPWLQKPVLLYWLMSLPIRVFGPTEFACRFFSAIGTALTCLLTFYIGKRLLNAKAGLWAMAILASTSMILRVGGSATIEPVLLPFIIAATAIFVHAMGSAMRLWHVLLMGVTMGIGMLAKGPIGLSPVPVIVTTLWLGRKTNPRRWRCLGYTGAAVVMAGCIFLAWAIPVNNATEGEFYRVFIGHHVFDQATKSIQSHGGNLLLYLPYYLVVIVLDLFPWTLHLPGAVSAVLGRRVGGQHGRALLVGWVVSIVVIMTLAVTKLPHYVLFIWPALALAVAGTIVAAQQNTLTARDRIWLRRGVWFFGPLTVAGALGLMVGSWFFKIPGLRWSGLASGIVLSVMTVIAIRQQLAGRPQASAKVLLIGMLVFQIPFLFGVLPAVERVKISPPIAQAIKEKTAKEIPVATYKYTEPTLNFYIGRQIEPLRDEEAVIAWSRQPQAGVLVIPKDVLAGIQQRHGFLALDEIASKKGFNYSKGTILEVLAMIRRAKD